MRIFRKKSFWKKGKFLGKTINFRKSSRKIPVKLEIMRIFRGKPVPIERLHKKNTISGIFTASQCYELSEKKSFWVKGKFLGKTIHCRKSFRKKPVKLWKFSEKNNWLSGMFRKKKSFQEFSGKTGDYFFKIFLRI